MGLQRVGHDLVTEQHQQLYSQGCSKPKCDDEEKPGPSLEVLWLQLIWVLITEKLDDQRAGREENPFSWKLEVEVVGSTTENRRKGQDRSKHRAEPMAWAGQETAGSGHHQDSPPSSAESRVSPLLLFRGRCRRGARQQLVGNKGQHQAWGAEFLFLKSIPV